MRFEELSRDIFSRR